MPSSGAGGLAGFGTEKFQHMQRLARGGWEFESIQESQSCLMLLYGNQINSDAKLDNMKNVERRLSNGLLTF